MASYSGHGSASVSDHFNPASYTRHFLGSPISWRAGSFGVRFPQGSLSAKLFSSLEDPRSSTSIDARPVLNAFNVFDREGELTRDYNCCGLYLPDLHELLKHFEEVHVLVVHPTGPAQITVPFNPQPLDGSTPHPFNSDDMELELDFDNSTHPAPALYPHSTHSSPSSSAPSPTLAHFAHQYGIQSHNGSTYSSPYTSQPPSPRSTNSSNNGRSNMQPVAVHTYPEEAFNAYTRFAADYSSHMPGTQFNGTQFSASGSEEIVVSSPASTPPPPVFSTQIHLPPPPPSLLLSKPFRCPKPNCNKSYKQANGLKYHMTHGSCNFAPPKDLEHVKDLLERKREANSASTTSLARSASLGALGLDTLTTNAAGEPFLQGLSAAYGDLGAITETALREVERPFACGVGDCQRRYKNMNGLRYHYQHSGDHGAVGLALLANGMHECLGNSGDGKGKRKSTGVPEDKEGRRKASGYGLSATMQRTGSSVTATGERGRSASIPVSRVTRVGYVETLPESWHMNDAMMPFTPVYTNSAGVRSQSVSPAHSQRSPFQQQTSPHLQQQQAYQAQFAELQRRQYVQAQVIQTQQQQQQQQPQYLAQQQQAQQQQERQFLGRARLPEGGYSPTAMMQSTESSVDLSTAYGVKLSPFGLAVSSSEEQSTQIPLDSAPHPDMVIEPDYSSTSYTNASTSKPLSSLGVHNSGINIDSQALGLSGLITKLGWILGNIEQYRQLLKCQGDEAQNLLNSFQSLLDIPQVDMITRRNLVVATQRLSVNTGLFPKCYELKNVELESNYRVKAGGSADVYRGRIEGQVVCLKVVRVFCDSDVNHFLKLVSREAILWGQLDHRNVLPIYGLYRFENGLCFVAPWMEAGDIVQYLRQNPGAPRRHLAMDVAQGLLYLHEKGIVHGDLKGANILINSGGIACIADFGLSSISDPGIAAWTSQSSAASKGGTSRWQAPELFDVERDEVVNNTAASDVYAWSCVCFEIFTGCIPFPNIRLDHTVVLQVMSGKRPSRPDASSLSWTTWGLTLATWVLMEDCWKTNPDERPTMPDIIRRLSLELDEDVRSIADEPSFLSPAHFRQKLSHPVNVVSISAIIGNILNGP